MKTTVKKVLLVLLQSLMFVFLAIGFVACGDEDSDSAPKSNPQKTHTLTLSLTSIDMTVWQNKTLYAMYSGEEAVVWSVSDSTVVSVENGEINALKVGEATVTAKAGNKTASCNVTVSAPVEELFSLEIEDQAPISYVGSSKNIEAELLYDGNAIPGVQYAYESFNEEVATVSASGVISSIARGDASLLVTATVNGFEFNSAVNLCVAPNGKVEISQSEIAIYSVAEFGGNTFKNTAQIQAKAYEKGVSYPSGEIAYSAKDATQDVFTVTEEGLVTANHAGEAVLVASYTGSDQQTVSEEVTIVVKRAELVADKDPLLIDLSDITYTIDTEEVFGEQIDFEKAIVFDGKIASEILFEGNDLDFSTVAAGEKTLSISTRDLTYTIGIDAWSQLIETADDLNALKTATNGKYRLENDLDMTGVEWKYADATTQFSGTFDGQDKEISGLTLSSANGLFAKLYGNAIVKNLTLSCVLSNSSSKIGALAAAVEGHSNVQATVENVNVTVIDRGQGNGGLIGAIAENTKVKINNSNIRYYEATRSVESGAVLGRTLGSVSFSETKVVSGSQICGTSSQNNNTDIAASLNAMNIAFKPEALEKLNIVDFETSKAYTLDEEVGTVTSVSLYGNEVREITVSDGSYDLLRADVEGLQGGAVEILFKNSEGAEFFYEIPLIARYTLTKDNITLLATATIYEYVLGEDIDMTGISYNPSGTFKGVLDGNGHTISNLTVKDGKGGLFVTISGATIKNLAIVNATIASNANQSGIIASTTGGANTIENVFISGTMSPSATNTSEGKWQGGILGRHWQRNTTLTLTNVIVNLTELDDAATVGFVCGYSRAPIALTDCYFIGGNGNINGTRTGYSCEMKQTNVNKYADVDAFNTAYSELTLTEELSAWWEAYLDSTTAQDSTES